LEDDIITDGYLDKITSHFFEISELPQFDLISIADNSQDKQE
jgi:hypothetical protein